MRPNDKKLNTSHPGDKKLITGIFLFIEDFPRRMYASPIKKKTNAKVFRR